jgi:hypothetical protein
MDGLVRGMILGELSPNDPSTVTHGGVYAGNGMVYSFSAANAYASLRPYNSKEWDIYAWHGAVFMEED